MQGRSSCEWCPAGHECEATGLTAPAPCAQGHYCEDQTDMGATPTAEWLAANAGPPEDVETNKLPCPAGYYGPSEGRSREDECMTCPGGYYCLGPVNGGLGRAEVDGPCEAGYLCAGAAAASAPERADGANAATTSGPCPAGHYCPAATAYPVPCPPGTWQPETGQSECDPCPLGKYCHIPGLHGEIEDLPKCEKGYHCILGANSSMPTDGLTGRPCREKYFCLYGVEAECPEGYYNNRPGRERCDPCPAGYYCPTATETPIPCGDGRYCPERSGAGLPCAAGTYTDTSVYGLETAEQCSPCARGSYCLGGGGDAVGLCQAGSFCISGATASSAAEAGWDESSADSWDEVANGIVPCPAGFYCEAGAVIPSPCPDGTYSTLGSGSEASCSSCDAGHYCLNGTRQELTCPAGHYCRPGADEPTPCPRGTHRLTAGAEDLEQCRTCPAGALCDDTGIADPENYPCPPGYYCPEPETFDPATAGSDDSTAAGAEDSAFDQAADSADYDEVYQALNEDVASAGSFTKAQQKIQCPTGTYRAEPGAGAEEDCAPCPPGSYCPEPATVTPHLCPNGTYCAPVNDTLGASAPIDCPAGSYCPAGATEAYLCPAGFYCEGASEYYHKCPNGTYCPPG